MEIKTQLINFLVYGAIITYFGFLLSFINNNEDYLEDRYHITYIIIIIVPLLLCAYLMMLNQNDKRIYQLFILITIIIVCLLFFPMLYSIFNWVLDKVGDINKYLVGKISNVVVSKELNFMLYNALTFLSILILLIPLAIIYNLLFVSSNNDIINFIFFIPCLFSDFVKYLIDDYKNTSTVVFVLLVIEALLIALYILLPQLSSYLYPASKDKEILKKPKLLNSRVILTDDKMFRNDSDEYVAVRTSMVKEKKKFSFSKMFNNFVDKQIMGIDNDNDGSVEKSQISNLPYLENFSVSLWLTLNTPSGSKDEENEIFCVGDIVNPDRIGGYPRILYLGNGDLKFIFIDTDDSTSINEDTQFSTIVPFQTWNYIVVNYNNNKADLFINSVLVYSSLLTKSLPSRKKQILGASMGFENNTNIHGALCNIKLFNTPLDKNEISRTYNELKINNPPIK